MAGSNAIVARAGVHITPDLEGFRQELDRQLQRVRDATVRVQVVPDLDAFLARVRAAAELASQTIRVRLDVDVDHSALAGLGNSLGGGGGGSPGRVVGNLTRNILKLSAALGALGSLIPVLAGLVGATTQLAGAALLLPGAILAAGAAMATFKVATSGFAEALGGDEEALRKLAPAARETVNAIKSLEPAWNQVKSAVQDNFFQGFAEDVRNLAGKYLPVLESGMSSVASQMNAMARYAADALMQPEQVGAVNNIFGQLSTTIANAKTSLGDFVAGFLQLGSIGSEYLPALGTAIADVGAKFRTWVQDNPEQIRMMIDNAIAGFQSLGAIVVNIGSIIGSIFSGLNAGMTGGLLANLQLTTQAIAQFFATIEAQTALQTLGVALQTAGAALRDVLLAGLQAILPAIQALAPVLAQVAVQVSSILVPAFQVLGSIFTTLGPIIQQNAALIAGFVLALTGIGIAIKAVMVGIAAYNAIMRIWQALTTAFTAVQWLLNAAMAANPIGLVVVAITALVAALVLAWQNSETFRNIVTTAWNAVLAAGQALVSGVQAAFAWFGSLPGLVGGWMSSAYNAFVSGWNAVVNWFRGIPNMILGALGNLGRLLWDAGVSIVNGLWDGLRSAFQPMIDWVSGIAGWIASVKGPISYDKRLLIPAGKAIMDGLHNGLETNFRDVMSLVGGMADRIASPFEQPIDVDLNAKMDRQLGRMSSGMSAEVRGVVSSEDFGFSSGKLAEEVAAGITGATLRVDGNGVAKLVNKTNTRTSRR